MGTDFWQLIFAGMVIACVVVNLFALITSGGRRLTILSGIVFLGGVFLLGIEDVVEMTPYSPKWFHVSGLATVICISGLWPFISQIFNASVNWILTGILSSILLFLYLVAHLIPPSHEPAMLVMNGLVFLIGMITILSVILSRADDMDDKRRRLRNPFIMIVGAWTATAAILGSLAGLKWLPHNLALLDEVGLAIIVLGVTVLFTQSKPELFPKASSPLNPDTIPDRKDLDAKDDNLLSRLQMVMEIDRIWQDETLTLGTLANRLCVPEKRLRAVINKRMRFRNFSTFVNRYRIEEAKRRLGSSAHSTENIATIAYACGFGSLGPFGRAFKAITGLTPSEFRLAAKHKKS